MTQLLFILSAAAHLNSQLRKPSVALASQILLTYNRRLITWHSAPVTFILSCISTHSFMASIAFVGRSLRTCSGGRNWILAFGCCYTDIITHWSVTLLRNKHHLDLLSVIQESPSLLRSNCHSVTGSCFDLEVRAAIHWSLVPLALSLEVAWGSWERVHWQSLRKLPASLPLGIQHHNCWPGTPYFAPFLRYVKLPQWFSSLGHLTRQQRLVYGPNLLELGNKRGNGAPQSFPSEQSQHEF